MCPTKNFKSKDSAALVSTLSTPFDPVGKSHSTHLQVELTPSTPAWLGVPCSRCWFTKPHCRFRSCRTCRTIRPLNLLYSQGKKDLLRKAKDVKRISESLVLIVATQTHLTTKLKTLECVPRPLSVQNGITKHFLTNHHSNLRASSPPPGRRENKTLAAKPPSPGCPRPAARGGSALASQSHSCVPPGQCETAREEPRFRRHGKNQGTGGRDP